MLYVVEFIDTRNRHDWVMNQYVLTDRYDYSRTRL
jgi:hypothetical protein